MDFDYAVSKLARDHQSLRQKNVQSQREKQRAERRAKERQKRLDERKRVQELERRKLRNAKDYVNRCEAGLKANENDVWTLQPTSIHGDGDKIALPPAVLARLMGEGDGGDVMSGGSPLTFRVGIRDPEYVFPASSSLKRMMEEGVKEDASMDIADGEEEDDHDDAESDTSAYLDELSHRYLAYTHGTVVEFTQDEGFIGLPKSIAEKLLKGRGTIASRKTVDPSGASDEGEKMKVEDEEEKTPGHIAYGLFDVPDIAVEVTVLKLPKGKGCTLVPTLDALKKGFGALKDVKAVLEQSLIRTRATLSVNDEVHCWHRGIKFDLTVSSVTPTDYAAVSCINTDIEVDIDAPEEVKRQAEETSKDESVGSNAGRTLGGSPLNSDSSANNTGRTLKGGNHNNTAKVTPEHVSQNTANDNTTSTTNSQNNTTPTIPTKSTEQQPLLTPEPPQNVKDNVCTIQVRGQVNSARRRFDLDTNMAELFTFAASLSNDANFRLVTRFPRRVFELELFQGKTLKEAGFIVGQEMVMIESV